MNPMLPVGADVDITIGHVKHWNAGLLIVIRNRRPSFYSKIYILGCCFLSVAATSSATTIFVMRTSDSILIGADSRQNDGVRILPEVACKIVQSGDLGFWSSAQVYSEPLANFSIETIVSSASAGANNTREWVANFDRIAPSEMKRLAATVREKDPAKFKSTYDGKFVLEIVFAGFENGVPWLFYRDWKFNGTVPSRRWVDCPGLKCRSDPSDPARFCLGDCSETEEIIGRDKNWKRGGLVSAIRRLINAEINSDWQVGPPVDTLQIDRNGPRWIGQDPQSKCPPIVPQ